MAAPAARWRWPLARRSIAGPARGTTRHSFCGRAPARASRASLRDPLHRLHRRHSAPPTRAALCAPHVGATQHRLLLETLRDPCCRCRRRRRRLLLAAQGFEFKSGSAGVGYYGRKETVEALIEEVKQHRGQEDAPGACGGAQRPPPLALPRSCAPARVLCACMRRGCIYFIASAVSPSAQAHAAWPGNHASLRMTTGSSSSNDAIVAINRWLTLLTPFSERSKQP